MKGINYVWRYANPKFRELVGHVESTLSKN